MKMISRRPASNGRGDAPRRRAAGLRRRRPGLKSVALAALLCVDGVAQAEIVDRSLSGVLGLESRWYPEPGLHPGQRDHSSGFVIEPQMYLEDDKGRSVAVTPFFRYDAADSRRTHFDLREAYLLLFGEIGAGGWELRLGVEQVFWGVVESQRLVDIVNQIDFVEHPGGEEKLGQPAAHLTWFGDWGTLELFGLPYHRARTFTGRRGRLRLPPVIDNENERYESSAEEWHFDLAARYSHSLGPLDFGLTAFEGTNREPAAMCPNPAENPFFCSADLVQYYTQIRQFGADAQLTLGPWLFKLEAIQRDGALNLVMQEEDYAALVVGGEYTFHALFGSTADLTLFSEWHYDDRGRRATPSRSPGVFENDLFLAGTLALNDTQSTEIGMSFIGDLGRDTYAVYIGLERRLTESWSLKAEAAALLNIDKAEIHHSTRRDSFVELNLSYHF